MKVIAKEYLKEISAMKHYLNRLKARRKNLHLDVSFGSIDYSADRVQNSPKNKLEEAAVRMSDRLERIDNEIAKISVEIDDRIANIEKISNETHRDILYKRYVDDKSFEQISVASFVSTMTKSRSPTAAISLSCPSMIQLFTLTVITFPATTFPASFCGRIRSTESQLPTSSQPKVPGMT